MKNKYNTKWSDEELYSCVAAYIEMLNYEHTGEHFVKKHYYKKLAEQYGRTEKSIEFRMQNISFIFYKMGRTYVTGLPPAKNIGIVNAKKLNR